MSDLKTNLNFPNLVLENHLNRFKLKDTINKNKDLKTAIIDKINEIVAKNLKSKNKQVYDKQMETINLINKKFL
mgnify:CR=1 FL=1